MVNPRITIADVAKEAGVSTQTVSRVLNKKGEIRPQTRDMVLEVIQRLGYRPSTLARSLATNKTRTIGLIISDIRNPFFADVTRGVEAAAREHGYHVILSDTTQQMELEEASFDAFEDQWVDGVVLCNSRLPEDRLNVLLVRQPKVVIVSPEDHVSALGAVLIRYDEGMKQVVHHLLGRGRKVLRFLPGRVEGPSHRVRLRGFFAALEEAGIEPVHLVQGPFPSTPSGGYDAAKHVLESSPDLDALVCFNDLMAIGAMRALTEMGRRIPDDVAVIGNGDLELASFVRPSLTTLHVPAYDMGISAVGMLLAHLDGREFAREVIVKPELIIRESAP